MANTVAIVVCWRTSAGRLRFPTPRPPNGPREYRENNERILLASIGAVVQNVQLAVTAVGLTLGVAVGRRRGHHQRDAARLLGYPNCMRAIGTIPIGYPEKTSGVTLSASAAADGALERLRAGEVPARCHGGRTMSPRCAPFAMYRDEEDAARWEDADKRLGSWPAPSTGDAPNPLASSIEQILVHADNPRDRRGRFAYSARRATDSISTRHHAEKSRQIGRATRPGRHGLRPTESFQDLILTLQQFWGEQGCVILQPYDMEVGAGTFHPATTLRALGPKPWNAAYVQPSRRPKDGRYGENPNRLQHYYQFQVIMKPSPAGHPGPLPGEPRRASASTRCCTTSASSRTTGRARRWAPGASAGRCGATAWR